LKSNKWEGITKVHHFYNDMMEYENMAIKVGDKITIEINKSAARDRYQRNQNPLSSL